MKRLGEPTRTSADWEEAALDTIAAGGISAVAIPLLAQRLGVTKGSFYWHFKNLDDLLTQAMKRWEQADREALDTLQKIRDPGERLRALFAEATSAARAQALFLALAFSPIPKFAATVRRVSESRLRVLAGLYGDLGMTRAAARQQALLTYAAYLGWLHLRKTHTQGLQSDADVAKFVDHAQQQLGAV